MKELEIDKNKIKQITEIVYKYGLKPKPDFPVTDFAHSVLIDDYNIESAKEDEELLNLAKTVKLLRGCDKVSLCGNMPREYISTELCSVIIKDTIEKEFHRKYYYGIYFFRINGGNATQPSEEELITDEELEKVINILIKFKEEIHHILLRPNKDGAKKGYLADIIIQLTSDFFVSEHIAKVDLYNFAYDILEISEVVKIDRNKNKKEKYDTMRGWLKAWNKLCNRAEKENRLTWDALEY